MSEALLAQIQRRRTFAIISHPDAGKTTLTEKLLLFGGAIQMAGTVKGRKASRHATSDWMAMEKERGISITSSVMQFEYNNRIVNLLDTPGHEDFSEDTYRTLTAVDSALMVIDIAKGVEQRTIKLMEVCRLRTTPILTFVNKMDREGRDAIDVLDEVETVLNIKCAPVTWPIGMGKAFSGVFDLRTNTTHLFSATHGGKIQDGEIIEGLDNPRLDEVIGDQAEMLREEIELVRGASHEFDIDAYLRGELTPVFFGSAINNFGVQELLDAFIEYAPAPQPRPSSKGEIKPSESELSGFVFKIQANMNPAHRDRIAFFRVCSGHYKKGMKIKQVRLNKTVQISNAITFQADARRTVEEAWPGDIIGLHNHGTIQIGDTFTEKTDFRYEGIPYFAPEMFRAVILRDPMKNKQLLKGVLQLCEEGATQVFRPLKNNALILGAVGILQFEVAIHRLQSEYSVDSIMEVVKINTARWIVSDDPQELEKFKIKAHDNLALDGDDQLVYLAPTQVNLSLAIERWPKIQFLATREL